jgi:hypothetical protein
LVSGPTPVHNSSLVSGSKAVAVLLAVAFFSITGASVDRGDLCVKQPVDQCQGDQLVELGSTDADTDGKDFLFESTISSVSENGDVTLEFKDEDSTGFSDVSTAPFSTRMGSTNDLYNKFAFTSRQDEGTTDTITINNNEHNIEVDNVDLGSNSFQVTIDGGVDTYSGDVGDQVNDLFNEGEDTQFLDAGYKNKNHTLSTGEWKYVTVDGTDYNLSLESITDDDDSIYYKVDGSGDNADEGDEIGIGGEPFLVAEVIPFGNGDGEVTFTQYDAGSKYLEYGLQQDVSSPEGHLEYRLRWDGSSGSTVYSPSLFFSVDQGDNLPYDDRVKVEGQTVQNPLKVTDITPGSGVTVEIAQNENDPVNVTLVNQDTGSDIATIEGNRTDQGAFYTIYSDVKNEVLASFLDTSSSDTFTFPTGGSDLLSDQGKEYSFYFEIKERQATQDTRTTKLYTAETSGIATNPAPQINSVEAYNGDSWVPVENIGYNELEKIRVDVTDSNNEFLDVDLTYKNNYDNDSELRAINTPDTSISYSTKTSSYYIWDSDSLENNTDSGGYSLTVNASDGNTFTTDSRSWSYPFGEPDVSLSVTDSVVEDNFFYPEITVSCPEYECVNQNETIDVYLDPVAMEVAS